MSFVRKIAWLSSVLLVVPIGISITGGCRDLKPAGEFAEIGTLSGSCLGLQASPASLAAYLSQLRNTPKDPCIRFHSWQVFSRIQPVTESSDPLWLNWCVLVKDSTGASLICPGQGLPSSPQSTQKTLPKEPRQYQPTSVLDLLGLETAGQNLVGSGHVPPVPADLHGLTTEVLYNPITSQRILDCFQSGAPKTLDGDLSQYRIDVSQLKPHSQSCNYDPSSGNFDVLQGDSVVVKAVWWTTENNGQPIPVWDISKPQNGKKVGTWQTRVFPEIDKEKCELSQSDPAKPSESYDTVSPPDVPLGCYYTVGITPDDYREASRIKGRAVPASLRSNDGAIFPAGYVAYNYLLGFQVATKEASDWTWQAYWWSGRAFTAEQGNQEGDPALTQTGADPRWRHYVMSSTLGPIKDSTNTATTAFNPYLEAPLQAKPDSNCLTCHQYAAFHSVGESGSQLDYFFDSANKDIGLRNPPQGTHPCNGDNSSAGPDGETFQHGQRTDCLWSLADSDVPEVLQNSHSLFEVLESDLALRAQSPSQSPAKSRKHR